jgi:preprotein translocase subunit SecA
LHENCLSFATISDAKHTPTRTSCSGAPCCVREAADRKVGLRAFPVQPAEPWPSTRDWLAEMATGEGKTLTAGIAGVLQVGPTTNAHHHGK